jgi:cell division transport system ATP-binding protein
MVKFNKVTKEYPHGRALFNLSFELKQNEMAFLTGHSGAGKSTLLKLIMRLETPTRGSVEVAGKNLNQLSERKIPYLRRLIGVVFQDPHLLYERTVAENVALPMLVAGYGYEEIGKSVRAALDLVNLLDKEERYPLSLSGGEQQRIGIARAIVNRPALLLADEPTGNLDPELAAETMWLFERLNEAGTTVLIASHDLALINKMRHRVLTLKDGILIHDGNDKTESA